MNNIGILRALAILEGISYLLLLVVGMPLKYGMDMPGPNMVIGMGHGVLFGAYCLWVLIAGIQSKWSFKTILIAGFASLIPIGTFIADKKIFKPAQELRRQANSK